MATLMTREIAVCEDNRFEIIAKAKAHILESMSINLSPKEMKVLDGFLLGCWQMGWLKKYEEPQQEGGSK